MKSCTLRSLRRRSVSSVSVLWCVVVRGRGQNFSPSPSRDWKLRGGTRMVQRLWQAILDGLEKYCHAGVFPRAMAASCLVDLCGSATKSYCLIMCCLTFAFTWSSFVWRSCCSIWSSSSASFCLRLAKRARSLRLFFLCGCCVVGCGIWVPVISVIS